jgi:cob(I)alamin adenosyltransferase
MLAAVRNLAARAGSGDDGRTVLLAGGRIPKDDARVEAYGTVDETSSAVGVGKTLAQTPRVREICEELQRDLYILGAQLATGPEAKRTYGEITAEHVDRIEELCRQIEEETPQLAEMTGFILPGTVPASAHLDLARAVARRAERRLVALGDVDERARRWLNRLSLLLFLLARHEEAQVGQSPEPARTDG